MTRRNRGVALITAVLITALAGMVAASLAWDSALDMRRTVVSLDRDQALQIAFGAESWLEIILKDDDPSVDHLGEIWASELPGLPIEGGEVFGVVEDLQGRFNINNLVDQNGKVDQEAVEQFQRLLGALGLDPRIAGITADWIDPDQDAGFPDGAEDPIYTGFTPPYRAPNQLISSASELAAIEGIEKASFDILLPHIVALPGIDVPVNVNTATPFVLRSLDEGISEMDAERLLAEREASGFADFRQTFVPLAPDAYIDEKSQYFQLKLVVRIDTVRITYFSILQRSGQGDVTPILRSFGTN